MGMCIQWKCVYNGNVYTSYSVLAVVVSVHYEFLYSAQIQHLATEVFKEV